METTEVSHEAWQMVWPGYGAETGREGLPPENIKIYRVDAPDVSKRAQ